MAVIAPKASENKACDLASKMESMRMPVADIHAAKKLK
jgi:hypothetical protein